MNKKKISLCFTTWSFIIIFLSSPIIFFIYIMQLGTKEKKRSIFTMYLLFFNTKAADVCSSCPSEWVMPRSARPRESESKHLKFFKSMIGLQK